MNQRIARKHSLKSNREEPYDSNQAAWFPCNEPAPLNTSQFLMAKSDPRPILPPRDFFEVDMFGSMADVSFPPEFIQEMSPRADLPAFLAPPSPDLRIAPLGSA